MFFQNKLKKEISALANNSLTDEVVHQIKVANIDSTGLLDGKEIIEEYIEHREYGLAFEHLEYMIEEAEIELNVEQLERMNVLKTKMK